MTTLTEEKIEQVLAEIEEANIDLLDEEVDEDDVRCDDDCVAKPTGVGCE